MITVLLHVIAHKYDRICYYIIILADMLLVVGLWFLYLKILCYITTLGVGIVSTTQDECQSVLRPRLDPLDMMMSM